MWTWLYYVMHIVFSHSIRRQRQWGPICIRCCQLFHEARHMERICRVFHSVSLFTSTSRDLCSLSDKNDIHGFRKLLAILFAKYGVFRLLSIIGSDKRDSKKRTRMWMSVQERWLEEAMIGRAIAGKDAEFLYNGCLTTPPCDIDSQG